mgnify:CR=1 FL=1
MMLRTNPEFERGLADMRGCVTLGYAGAAPQRRVIQKMRHGFVPECVSTTKQTPSFDGQQASPSAALPVLFGCVPRRAQASHRGAVLNNRTYKRSQAWAYPNSFSHSDWRALSARAATQSPSKALAALPSVQVQRSSLAVASCKGRPLAQGQTCSPARPNSSAAGNLTSGPSGPSNSNASPVQAFGPRGVLRFLQLFHHHKGPEYVQ